MCSMRVKRMSPPVDVEWPDFRPRHPLPRPIFLRGQSENDFALPTVGQLAIGLEAGELQ